MTASPTRLSLPRNVPPDGNWYDPERIQVSTGGRITEKEAIMRAAFGDPIGEAYSNLYMNGQIVDLNHMLMCTRCNRWQPDSAFDKDSRLMNTRRGRRYYCKRCRSQSAIFDAPIIDAKTEARLIKGSKRRKNK